MKKLLAIALVLSTANAGVAMANAPIESFKKFQLKNGNYNPSVFKNKTVNGLKIDDCLPTLDDSGKAVMGDSAPYQYNACNAKNSKHLLELAKQKPNFAGKYVLVSIANNLGDYNEYIFAVIDKANKQVIFSPHYFSTSDNKTPAFEFKLNDTKACTSAKSKQVVNVFVPTLEEIISNKDHVSKKQCLEFKKGKLYSTNWVEYMANQEG